MRRLIALTAIVLAIFALPSGASAHTQTFYHGSDYVIVGPYHNALTVCDKEADSNGFYAAVRYSNGLRGSWFDQNGASAGCSYYFNLANIVQIQLCEAGGTCGLIYPVY